MSCARIATLAVLSCLPLVAAAQADHSHEAHAQTQQVAPPASPTHEGHDSGEPAASVLRTPIPQLTEADRQAAVPVSAMHASGDNSIHTYSLVNRLEAWNADPGTGIAWEAEGWVGQDINRLWWRTDGELVDGETEAANLEALYGHSFSPWWDWVVGARQDFKPGDPKTFAAFGVQGLAPQWFDLKLTGYVGGDGQTAARFEAEYELLLTNRLILQPLLDTQFFGKSDADRGIGSGLSTAEAGLRLRYEIHRQFAPYLGIVHEHSFGKTADLRRQAGESVSDTRLVGGLRIWF